MTYQEYYNITVKEDIPEGGVAPKWLIDKAAFFESNVLPVLGKKYPLQ